MARWHEDLRSSRTLEEWSSAWRTISTSSRNVLSQEALYKVLLRWYLVPSRIAKAYPDTSANCFRGCSARGDVLHTWWTCPFVLRFWHKVYKLLSRLFHTTLRRDPWQALLHFPITTLRGPQRKLATFVLMAAKQTIAHAWKKQTIPYAEFRARIQGFYINEHLSSILSDRIANLQKVWNPWCTLESLPLPS